MNAQANMQEPVQAYRRKWYTLGIVKHPVQDNAQEPVHLDTQESESVQETVQPTVQEIAQGRTPVQRTHASPVQETVQEPVQDNAQEPVRVYTRKWYTLWLVKHTVQARPQKTVQVYKQEETWIAVQSRLIVNAYKFVALWSIPVLTAVTVISMTNVYTGGKFAQWPWIGNLWAFIFAFSIDVNIVRLFIESRYEYRLGNKSNSVWSMLIGTGLGVVTGAALLFEGYEQSIGLLWGSENIKIALAVLLGARVVLVILLMAREGLKLGDLLFTQLNPVQESVQERTPAPVQLPVQEITPVQKKRTPVQRKNVQPVQESVHPVQETVQESVHPVQETVQERTPAPVQRDTQERTPVRDLAQKTAHPVQETVQEPVQLRPVQNTKEQAYTLLSERAYTARELGQILDKSATTANGYIQAYKRERGEPGQERTLAQIFESESVQRTEDIPVFTR